MQGLPAGMQTARHRLHRQRTVDQPQLDQLLHLLTQAAVAGQLRLHVADPLQQKALDVVVAAEQRQTHVRRRHLDIVQRLAEAHRTTEDLPVAGGAGQRPMAKAHPQRHQPRAAHLPAPAQCRAEAVFAGGRMTGQRSGEQEVDAHAIAALLHPQILALAHHRTVPAEQLQRLAEGGTHRRQVGHRTAALQATLLAQLQTEIGRRATLGRQLPQAQQPGHRDARLQVQRRVRRQTQLDQIGRADQLQAAQALVKVEQQRGGGAGRGVQHDGKSFHPRDGRLCGALETNCQSDATFGYQQLASALRRLRRITTTSQVPP